MSGDQPFGLGEFVVHPASGEIESDGTTERLEPRSMQVLLALCARAGEVVGKSELISEVWGEAFVSDEVLTHAIWDVRRAFGDKASRPRVIQTIPKRGYRLIAMLERRTDEGRTESDDDRSLARSAFRWPTAKRTALVSVAFVAMVALVAFGSLLRGQYSAFDRPGDHPPMADSERLLAIASTTGVPEVAAKVDELMPFLMTATRDLTVRQVASCTAQVEFWCLAVTVLPSGESWELRATVRDMSRGTTLWAFPALRKEPNTGLEELLAHFQELVAASFALSESRFFSDPDIEAWIAPHYDPRAVHAFLEAVEYVYLDEVGSVDQMKKAIELDPTFIAPRVWRAPSIAAKGSRLEVEEYLLALERMSSANSASAFEKAMVRWALALLADESALEKSALKVRHLKVALRHRPGNRPAILAQAAEAMALGQFESALDLVRPLVAQQWIFPGTYSMAAVCAVMIGSLEEAREILQRSLSLESVAPISYDLLVAFSIFDEDSEAETRYRRLLTRRLRALLPEEPSLVTAPREILANVADNEGRSEAAARLRAETEWLSLRQ